MVWIKMFCKSTTKNVIGKKYLKKFLILLYNKLFIKKK